MNFYSKLLLFGEHSVIKGSAAFAIPFLQFKGYWGFADVPTESNKVLRQYFGYLKKLTNNSSLEADLTTFKTEIDKGLIFNSNIPQGYGLGSSGALCAGIYQQYVTKKKVENNNKKENISRLKQIFAQLESFFHGSSSGIDPLICYLNQPLYITASKKYQLTPLPTFPKQSNQACFLIDTGIKRQTAPFVNIFLAQCEDPIFLKNCLNILGKHTNLAIQSFLQTNFKELFAHVAIISDYQYHHLSKLIPPNFQEIWKGGLQSSSFKLKLCGAGGGGFLLGFSSDWEKTQAILKDYDLVLVNYF